MALLPAIRPVRWPDDEAGLRTIDNSLTTSRIYRVERTALSFQLVAEEVDPPIHKSYGLTFTDSNRLRKLGHVVVAELDGALVGMAAAEQYSWNRRVQVEHIYVSPIARGRGVGRALMDSIVAYARVVGSWCVWLETQNVNYPAVQFYQRYGFRLCGLDERLYDRDSAVGSEVALYFAMDLPRTDGYAHSWPRC